MLTCGQQQDQVLLVVGSLGCARATLQGKQLHQNQRDESPRLFCKGLTGNNQTFLVGETIKQARLFPAIWDENENARVVTI